MASTTLPLPGNPLHQEKQILEFDKIAAFIGGNGSGKSTILKSIFDEKLNPKSTVYSGYKIVCFSSGQNESYSRHFSEYLNTERKKNALTLDCFYYDKIWSKLLIFLATVGRPNGFVRDFLRKNNYVNENEFDGDDSTQLAFDVKVEQTYIKIVKDSLEDEEKGESNVMTNKAYHQTLHNFINTLIDDGYDFDEVLSEKGITLTQNEISKVSFETDSKDFFDSTVTFFTQAADNDFFFIKDSFNLTFEKSEENGSVVTLGLEALSDGEYQILFLYALIDLFDSEQTIYLFDEADSHLHYKNIDRLWDVYNKTKGKVITTTHLIDSITKAGINRVQVVEGGKINTGDKLKYVAERLRDLSEINDVHSQALSLCENIVLIDNVNDWTQFKLLLKRKLLSDDFNEIDIDKKLDSFTAIKCNSGFKAEANDVFANKKISWVERFVKYLGGQSYRTKNVFLICDRDELPLENIGAEKSTLLVEGKKVERFNNNQLKCHLLSWKRREIKHYLLSPTALEEKLTLLNDDFYLGGKSKLISGCSGDYDVDGNYNDQLATLESDKVKEAIAPYINGENGFCSEKTQKYIDKIPPEEISEDIVHMYNYLVGKQ